MPATAFFNDAMLGVLKANTTLFGGAGAGPQVGLFKNDVNPTDLTVTADLVFLTSNLSDPDPMLIRAGDTPQTAFRDEATGTYKIRLKETGDGFLFNATDFKSRTGRVYGYFVLNDDGELLYARRLDTPIDLEADFASSVNLPEVVLEFLPGVFR